MMGWRSYKHGEPVTVLRGDLAGHHGWVIGPDTSSTPGCWWVQVEDWPAAVWCGPAGLEPRDGPWGMTDAEALEVARETLDRIATSPHPEDAPMDAQRTLNRLGA